jgi:integrase/recombinase XerD
MVEQRGRVYNRIFDKQEWKEVNPENIAIMNDYLEEYTQRKKKPTTIAQYKNDLRIVLLYIKRKLNNKCILELVKKDFRRFSIWLGEDLKLSNARSNRLMSSVRSLLTYVEDDDDYADYDNNVAKKVKGLPREAVKTDEDDFFLTYEQVMLLREELIKRGKLQHAVLLMVFFDSGGRRNEVTQVLRSSVNEGNKTNIVIGKRGKPFPLVFLSDTRELIAEYLRERGEDNVESLWIIGSGDNKKAASYETLYDRVVYMSKVLSEIQGKNVHFFPHSLRHSRCECLLQGNDPRILDKEGKPKKFSLEEVQLFLHHSDPKTTQGYAKDHSEDTINDMFNFE